MRRASVPSSGARRAHRYVGRTATVLHYIDRWLPVSAGFVHAVLVRSDHAAVVVSRDGLIEPDAFPGPPV